jgi:hypothetical protein
MREEAVPPADMVFKLELRQHLLSSFEKKTNPDLLDEANGFNFWATLKQVVFEKKGLVYFCLSVLLFATIGLGIKNLFLQQQSVFEEEPNSLMTISSELNNEELTQSNEISVLQKESIVDETGKEKFPVISNQIASNSIIQFHSELSPEEIQSIEEIFVPLMNESYPEYSSASFKKFEAIYEVEIKQVDALTIVIFDLGADAVKIFSVNKLN